MANSACELAGHGGMVEPARADSAALRAAEVAAAPDPLYSDAVRVVRSTRKPSISVVQRHLQIRYNHAACLLEEMELRGVVTPLAADGTRAIIDSAAARQSQPESELSMNSPSISLDKFLELQRRNLDRFEQDWRKQNKANGNKMFPMSLPVGEWDEQLRAFES